MLQEEIIRSALAGLDTTPETPISGAYLSMDDATAIVARTIDEVERAGNTVEHRYIFGHRLRLATTLTMIPRAAGPGARFLDVGCYGYMAYWAHAHLGYDHVEGIEWLPDVAEPVLERAVVADGQTFGFRVHNFDISRADWPLAGTFDTIIMLETLEHVGHDPSGVLVNVRDRLSDSGVLVISVPNSVSYKTLQEFMTGAPPWTYWFFHPDLRHEPRHSFEYTPIFLKAALRAAGFQETAFRTLCAYADRAGLDPIFAIGEALSVEPRFFGDTLIAQATRVADGSIVRYPDLIYDGESYYQTTHPWLAPRLERAVSRFMEGRQRSLETECVNADLTSENTALRAQVAQEGLGAAELALGNTALREQATSAQHLVSDLAERNNALRIQLAEALKLCGDYAQLLTDRAEAVASSPLRRMLFRSDGRPVKALRVILFHRSGKPRSPFGRVVLKKSGRPRPAFRQWMTSDGYLSLPGAVRNSAQPGRIARPDATGAAQPRHIDGRAGWMRLLFRPDGRPVKPVRMALFHKNGTPRSAFRRIVLKKSGRPRPAFQEWMMQTTSAGGQ